MACKLSYNFLTEIFRNTFVGFGFQKVEKIF